MKKGNKTKKEELKKRLLDLVEWKPETWPVTSETLREAEEFCGEKIDPEVPIFCESSLYILLGKNDARTLLGKLRRIGELAGIKLNI